MYTNRDTGSWLKLCADLEHEAAPPFPAPPLPQHIAQEFQLVLQEMNSAALGMGPLQPDPKPHKHARCDNCDELPWCWHGIDCGIETYLCWVCAGLEEDPDAAGEDDKRESDFERPTVVNCQTGALERA